MLLSNQILHRNLSFKKYKQYCDAEFGLPLLKESITKVQYSQREDHRNGEKQRHCFKDIYTYIN